jgi:hypothetical protein
MLKGEKFGFETKDFRPDVSQCSGVTQEAGSKDAKSMQLSASSPDNENAPACRERDQ